MVGRRARGKFDGGDAKRPDVRLVVVAGHLLHDLVGITRTMVIVLKRIVLVQFAKFRGSFNMQFIEKLICVLREMLMINLVAC